MEKKPKTVGQTRKKADKGLESVRKRASERVEQKRIDRLKISTKVRKKARDIRKQIEQAENGGVVSDSIKKIADRFAKGKLDLSNPKQAELVDKIVKQSTLEEYKMTPKRTMQEYFFLALANLGDYVNWDKDGRMYLKSKDELTREQLSAIREINTRRDSNGNYFVVKLKFYDKLEALRDIAKHFGLFEKDNIQKAPSLDVERVLSAVPPELNDLVRTQLIRELTKFQDNESKEDAREGMGLRSEGPQTIN